MADHAADVPGAHSEQKGGPPPRRRRRGRRWLIRIGAVLLVLLLIVLLLPTFVSWGLGQGLIRSAIDRHINGSARIDQLRVGWFSGQSLRGLRVIDPTGAEAASLDVRIDEGLARLLLAPPRSHPITITISGSLTGQVREDGSVSFRDLLASPAKKPGGAKRPSPGGFRMPGMPPMNVKLDDLAVRLTHVQTGQALALEHVNGHLAFAGFDQPITAQFKAQTRSGDVAGRIALDASADGLFDPSGRLNLAKASAQVSAEAQSLPLPLFQSPAQLESLTLRVASDDLTRRIVTTVNARGRLEGHEPSSLAVDGALGNILSANGAFTPTGASAQVALELRDVPVHVGASGESAPIDAVVRSLTAALASDDLTSQVTLAIDGQTQIAGSPATPLTANLKIAQPIKSDGAVDVAIERVTGRISGRMIPTPILQPFLKDTPIVVLRDVGPTVDVEASFGAGANGDPREISITAAGARARLEIVALIDTSTYAIRGSHLLLAAGTVDPALVKAFTSLQIDRPTDLEIRLTSFAAPASGRDHRRELSQMAATGTVRTSGPVNLVVPGREGEESPAVALQDLALRVESPRLDQSLALDGSAIIDGAEIRINERLTNLFDSAGKLAPLQAQPEGTLSVRGLGEATIEKFAPQQGARFAAIVGPVLDIRVSTQPQQSAPAPAYGAPAPGGALAATVQLAGERLQANLSTVQTSKALAVSGGQISLTLTPQAAALLQEGATEPVALGSPIPIVIDVQPFDLPSREPFKYQLPFIDPIRANVTIAQAVIEKAPRLAQPVALSNLVAEITCGREGDGTAYGMSGDVVINKARNENSIAAVRYRVRTTQRGGAISAVSAAIQLAELSVRRLETLLGYESGAISTFTGDAGTVTLRFNKTAPEQYSVRIDPELPNITGMYTAVSDGHMLTVTAETSNLLASRAALERLFNPAASPEASAGGRPAPGPDQRVRIGEDVPLALDIRKLQAPVALLSGQTFDPSQVQLDVNVEAGAPLVIKQSGQPTKTLRNLQATLSSSDLAKGVQVALRGLAETDAAPAPTDVAAAPPGTISRPAEPGQPSAEQRSVNRGATGGAGTPAAGQAGVINVEGVLANLVSSESKLSMEQAKLDLKAKVEGMPTLLVDALANMKGMLVAAMGPQMAATIDARDFSRQGGAIDADVQATSGNLSAKLRMDEQVLRTRGEQPLAAELTITPALREILLQKIHPILADVRTTEQPLRVKVMHASAPTDGDASKLKADIEITVGKVELDSGSTMLGVLSLFNQQREVIPGEIEPIVAKIRKGVVNYDRFVVHIDKYTMAYSGQIDLVKRRVDLRTEIPLEALAHTFRELEGYADKIVVPLVTRGEFGNLKTQIDPKFDIGKAALSAGFRGSLQDLLKQRGGRDAGRGGGLFEELLDDLLKPRDEKPAQRDPKP